MKKRLLSILLVLIMALSVLPTAAFAEDGGKTCPRASAKRPAQRKK